MKDDKSFGVTSMEAIMATFFLLPFLLRRKRNVEKKNIASRDKFGLVRFFVPIIKRLFVTNDRPTKRVETSCNVLKESTQNISFL